MARRAIISFFDWAQYPGVTVTGGSFLTQFPASNMLTLQPQVVAQVNGTTVSFTVDLTTTRTVGLIHLQNLVTDNTGTIRVQCGSYDSGTVNSWATDGSGVYSQNLYTALGRPRIFIPSTPVSASSATIDINSGGGDLMIGFVGVCEIWETPDNMLSGNIMNVFDESDITTIPFGTSYIVPRAKRRRLDFSLPPLKDNNIGSSTDFYTALDLALVNGKSSPVIICKYPEDTNNLERNSVWGLINNDTPFTNRFFGYNDVTFQVKQLV